MKNLIFYIRENDRPAVVTKFKIKDLESVKGAASFISSKLLKPFCSVDICTYEQVEGNDGMTCGLDFYSDVLAGEKYFCSQNNILEKNKIDNQYLSFLLNSPDKKSISNEDLQTLKQTINEVNNNTLQIIEQYLKGFLD